ncbi:MAG: ATP-binding protein, partial [Candidatus Methanomethylophilaceae archaeon]
IMQRRIYDDLVKWKNDPDRKPLLLEGVRQCGKTYILKEFGKRNYTSTIYFNFEKDKGIDQIFNGELDPTRIVKLMSQLKSKQITEGSTLIILDEVQIVPRALTSLKYFCEEAPGYHIVCAGSLLGLLTSKPDSFPVGKVDRMTMYPMDFLEFLSANEEEGLVEFIESREIDERIPEIFHNRLSSYLDEYFFTGGMPNAVRSWVNNHDPQKVNRILRNILSDYRDDFAKHAGTELPRVLAVWDALPGELAKENRKFIFSHAMKDARSDNMMDAVMWIVNAGLAHRVCCVEEPSVPLKNASNRTSFKLYASDVGLLRVMSDRNGHLGTDLDEDKIYRGAAAENLVVCQMLASGLKEVFYWKEKNYEVDLLMDTDSGPVPVEVKSGENTNATSLKMYMERHSPERAFLTSMSDETGGKYGRIPLYCSGRMFPMCTVVRTEGIGETVRKKDPVWRMFFDESDWERDDDVFTLSIPRKTHGMRKPTSVKVFRKDMNMYTCMDVETSVDLAGNVMIGCDGPFEGFVEISRGPQPRST